MPERLRIGALSRQTGRSVHAIRWYEAQGLIPGVERDASGYRVYSGQHVQWIELMDRLRRTGMSIAQMREYTALVKQGKSTLRQRRTLLAAHRLRVEARIADWQAALQLLDRKLHHYGEWISKGRRPAALAAGPAQPRPPATERRPTRR